MFDRYHELVMSKSPKAFLPLDDTIGTANAQDVSGNDLHFNANTGGGAPSTMVGPMGQQAPVYTGGRGSSRSSAVSTVTDNLTMECWIQGQAVGGNDQTLMYNGNGGLNGYGLVVSTGSNHILRLLLGGVTFLATGGFALAGSWQYVCVRRTAGSWTLMVDLSITGSLGSNTPNAPSGTFQINGSVAYQAAYQCLAFYEEALTDDECLEHFYTGRSVVSKGLVV